LNPESSMLEFLKSIILNIIINFIIINYIILSERLYIARFTFNISDNKITPAFVIFFWLIKTNVLIHYFHKFFILITLNRKRINGYYTFNYKIREENLLILNINHPDQNFLYNYIIISK
jgi:hypothetical protein